MAWVYMRMFMGHIGPVSALVRVDEDAAILRNRRWNICALQCAPWSLNVMVHHYLWRRR